MIRVTKHAMERMEERNIEAPIVLEAVHKGIKLKQRDPSRMDKQVFKHKTKDLYVVMNVELTHLITVYWNDKNWKKKNK